MSDNIIVDPFAEIIGEFEAAEQAAVAQVAKAESKISAAHVTALAAQAAERKEAERRAVIASRRNLAAVFIATFQGKVVTAGRQRAKTSRHAWSKQDFLDAKALTEYLTSTADTKLKVRPRQAVSDVTWGIFEDMFKAERKLPREKSLPPRYFQGGRDILARKPKETGQHVGSQSRLDRTLAEVLPEHLRPEGWQEPQPQTGNVVYIDRRGKKEDIKITPEAPTAS